jgi:hypothetical protein
MNGLSFSVAISVCQRWVIVSMYDLSSPMCVTVFGLDIPTLYMCFTWSILRTSLLDSPTGFSYSLVGFVTFSCWKSWSMHIVRCSFVLSCLLRGLESYDLFISYFLVPSGWALSTAKPMMCPEESSPLGPVKPLTVIRLCSTWFRTLSKPSLSVCWTCLSLGW